VKLSPGVAGLDVLKDRAVRVPVDEPGAVRRGSRPLHDLAARGLKGGENRARLATWIVAVRPR
jgi:hypothetical protein